MTGCHHELFERIINPALLVRKINITACNIVDEKEAENDVVHEQLDLFNNNIEKSKEKEYEKIQQKDELRLKKTLLDIKNKYGKNSILKGMNYEEGATTKERKAITRNNNCFKKEIWKKCNSKRNEFRR